MCIQMLLQQMSAMQQHQLVLSGIQGNTSSHAGPGLQCLAGLSKPSGPKVQPRLLQLPGQTDSQSSVVSSESQASALQIFQGRQQQNASSSADNTFAAKFDSQIVAVSQQSLGPPPPSPTPQPLQPSLQKMNSSAKIEDRVFSFDLTTSADDGASVANAEMPELLEEEILNILNHNGQPSDGPAVGDAHQLADVPTPRHTDELTTSVCPPMQEDREAIAENAPARSKASQMLKEYTDMQADRAARQRKRKLETDSEKAAKKVTNKDAKKKKAAAKRVAKAAAKRAAKAAAKTDAEDAAKKVAKEVAKTDAEDAAKKAAKEVALAVAGPAAGSEAQAPKRHSSQVVTHEKSRSQFCARSGKGGPGSSRTFKYDPSDAASKEQAEKDAQVWLDQFKQ